MINKINKTEQLKQIRDEVWNLKTSPLYQYRTKNHYYPVIGEGNHDAKIMFIGEAPGENEAKQGRPFCGAAGEVLTTMCQSVGLKRSDVYVTNIVKDRPPGNRDPLPEEIALYAPFLDRQILIIKPDVITTLGRFSMRYIAEKYNLGDKITGISHVHGKTFEAWADYGVITIVPLFHPAVALYKEDQRQILFNDFKVFKSFI